MITNFSFGVPGEIADADYPMPLGNYFDIEKDMTQVGGEFLLVRDEDSNFYFLCTDDCDIELLCRERRTDGKCIIQLRTLLSG